VPRLLEGDPAVTTALPMTEDDLLAAITDALTLYGWRWTHPRRSDKALTMGHSGAPDIIAARKGIVYFIELKSARGRLDAEQFAWMSALGWPQRPQGEVERTAPPGADERIRLRVWWPEDLDAALRELA
jgi:hypothetical protein